MTNLDDIEKAEAAATKGDWEPATKGEWEPATKGDLAPKVGLHGVALRANWNDSFECKDEDAKLICLMRNNILAMIAELRAAREK